MNKTKLIKQCRKLIDTGNISLDNNNLDESHKTYKKLMDIYMKLPSETKIEIYNEVNNFHKSLLRKNQDAQLTSANKPKIKEEKKEEVITEEKKAETKKGITILKIGAYISIVIIIAGVLGASIMVMMKAQSLDTDKTMITFVYILGAGWMFAIAMMAPLIIARKEIWNKLKTFGKKSKVIIFRIIGGDANENEVVLRLEGNTMEIGDNKIIINTRKSTMRDGIRVMTYVADNALAHDYFQDPKETLKAIGERLSKKKAEDFHDIYSDPIRVDAKYFNETFLAAQQTNPDILKKIIAFMTSKNVLTLLGAIAIAAAASAFLSLQANNMLNAIPFCNPTVITP